MKRFTTPALIATLCSALLSSASAVAAGTAPTPAATGPAVTQMAASPITLADESRVTCGRLTDLDLHSATIKPYDRAAVKVALTDRTVYLPLNQATAIAGLKKGDYVSARVSDEGEGTTQLLKYSLTDFCHAIREIIIVNGKVTGHGLHTLDVMANNGDPYAFELTNRTHYFVNGKAVAGRPDIDDRETVRVRALEEADGSYSALDVYLWTK